MNSVCQPLLHTAGYSVAISIDLLIFLVVMNKNNEINDLSLNGPTMKLGKSQNIYGKESQERQPMWNTWLSFE